MEAMSQLQATLHRALFRPPHPVIVTEQHADPVELVFQAFLRLDPEQRARSSSAAQMALGRPAQAAQPQRPRTAGSGNDRR